MSVVPDSYSSLSISTTKSAGLFACTRRSDIPPATATILFCFANKNKKSIQPLGTWCPRIRSFGRNSNSDQEYQNNWLNQGIHTPRSIQGAIRTQDPSTQPIMQESQVQRTGLSECRMLQQLRSRAAFLAPPMCALLDRHSWFAHPILYCVGAAVTALRDLSGSDKQSASDPG